jgi:glycosyltransferase involved in cell wall biosynthesis
MSIVVLEAGLVGTPVLLTDRCGFDEVSTVGGGKVVAATADDLAVGLDSLLTNRSELADMGNRLKSHVQHGYTWDVIVERFLGFYEQILARPNSGRAVTR